MKKVLKVLSIPFIIILIITIYTIYLVNNNKNYLNNIINNIKGNYKLDEEITYLNEYNHYYIFTTKTRVIVLNNEYEEVLNESIAIIKEKEDNQELIYKTNKLMYEETTGDDNELIYKYYDATTKEFIKETIMEMQ